MNNPSSNISSTQIEAKKGDIKLQKSLLKRGSEDDFDAIKAMFQQFIPEDEEIYYARYLGTQGFLGFGNRQFACVTERRVADISVGYFGELNYQDGYLEHINSGLVYKPNKLAIYIAIGLLTATIAIISEPASPEELIVGIVFGLVLALILLPFYAKIYYQIFKCGLVLSIREGEFVLAPYGDNVFWYTNRLLYIFTNRKLLTRANALYREFIIRREERLNKVEKYPLPDLVSRSEIPELTPLSLSSFPSVDTPENNIKAKMMIGLTIAGLGTGGIFAVANIVIPQLKEQKAKNLLEEANSLEETGNYESALEKYIEVVELKPESADARIQACLILNLVENPEPETTIYVCEAAISFAPYNHLLWKEKGDALLKLGKKEEALKSYQEVVEIQSDDSEVWHKIGLLLHEEKEEINEALDAFNKALEGNGKFGKFGIADAWQQKCYLLAELGEYTQETYYACNQRVDLVDYDYLAWKERGNALWELEGKREALESYQKAVEIQSDDSEVWYKIGVIYQERRWRSSALDAFDKAIEGNGKFGEFSLAKAWEQKCSIYLDLEQFQDAFAACDRIDKDLTNATVTGTSWETKNVRSGITTEAEVLFELSVNSRVRVIGLEYNSDLYLWYKIYSPQYQRQGWIASHLIRRD